MVPDTGPRHRAGPLAPRRESRRCRARHVPTRPKGALAVSLHFHWFLPTYGDSRNLIAGGHGSQMTGDRPADLRYLKQLVGAAEANGFEAVLTPAGLWCEDAWLTTAALIDATESLKFLVAFRPGLISPTLAAQMAATFQWHSQGRLLVNVVTGGESSEQRAFGDFLAKNARYERCDEYLEIIRRLWTEEEPVDVVGKYLRVEGVVPIRRRRSSSADRRRPPVTSPPSTPTPTSPGANVRTRWPRRSRGSTASRPRRAGNSRTASVFT